MSEESLQEKCDIKIAFCQWTYDKDFEETKLCIKRVSSYVDCTIINYSYNKSLNENDIHNLEWLSNHKDKYNLHVVVSEFKDNFPEMRNKYLEKAREIKVNWVCASDPDELYSEELAKNLRTLIEKYDKEGYNNIAVPCRDQFDAVEWLDSADLLKEVPMGYHETDYWKPLLIFKLLDDIKYEGVGIEKNVHETLSTRYKLNTLNLDKQYFYVHKKSALKIWRNASRNMFISGGGDNVGSKNRMWTELRQLCSSIGINDWNEFEKFINIEIYKYIEGNTIYKINKNLSDRLFIDEFKNKFKAWLEQALKSPPTKEGTETRETAKWYYALHKDEITPRIQDLINRVPEIAEETEIDNYVTKCYYQILGRHPDSEGLEHYSNAIREKRLKRSELVDILKNSNEYRERFSRRLGTVKNDNISDDEKIKYNKDEWDKVEKFVEKLYLRILGRQVDESGKNLYTRLILEKEIKPSDLVSILRSSDEYKDRNANKGIIGMMKRKVPVSGSNITINKFELKYNKINPEHKEQHNTVALCIMGYHKGIPLIEESLMAISDKVDEIHIQGDDFTEEDINKLHSHSSKVQVHIEPWKDDFSDYKNKCVSHATTEWVTICDHDEIPTQELADNLKSIIINSDKGNNYDMVSFDVIDVRRTLLGQQISEVRNKGGKPILHWNIPNPYIGNPHIWLKQNYYPWKEIHRDYAYKHIKEEGTDLERSVRNIFLGGGGDNSKEKNPNWIELRKVCDEFRIKTYRQFDETLRSQFIHPKLMEIIKKLDEMPWKDNELKDVLRYYYIFHPKEKKRLNINELNIF